MTSEEITKGNIAIAEFMNVPKCDRCKGCGNYKFGPGIYLMPEEMDYQESFDTLIHVYYKIREIIKEKSRTDLIIDVWKTWGSKIANCLCFGDIHSFYTSITSFIEWYNNQPQTNEQ